MLIIGCLLYSVLNLDQAFEFLLEEGRISQDVVDASKAYLKENRFDTPKYGVGIENGNGIINQANKCA